MTVNANTPRLRVGIIGAGNVATHIATSLHQSADVVQIYTPHMSTATLLADRTGAEATDSIANLRTDVDCIILSIKDDAVAAVLKQIDSTFSPDALSRIVWMHTAGSVDMNCFPDSMPNHGILYPLQTFSRDVAVDMRKVPFFIEGTTALAIECISTLARMLSDKVKPLDSEQRRQLHAAAVLACNMPMYLWSLAHDVLQAHGLDFAVMRPLLEVTLDKAMSCNPSDVITGPARRGDTATIAKHMADLPPQAANVYAILTNEILKKFNHPTLNQTPQYEQDKL